MYNWKHFFPKARSWVLLLACAIFLAWPATALCRPPNMSNGSESMQGDPVGGERKDEQLPAGGGYSIDDDWIQGGLGFKWSPGKPDGDKPHAPRMTPSLLGFMSGTPYSFVVAPTLWPLLNARFGGSK
jgi:hypothetical protein